MSRLVILGAGVAGLAAASRYLELKPGAEVVIVEKAATPGGLASGWGDHEFSADLGPHRIFTELPEIERLLPELIEKAQEVTVERRSQILIGTAMVDYPVRPLGIMKSLGPLAVARLGFSAVGAKLRPNHNPVTFEDAMAGNFGRATYDLLVSPYAEKVWKTPPGQLSAEIARVRVSAGNASRMVGSALRKSGSAKPTALRSFTYIRGGVKNLVASLRARAEARGAVIQTNEAVTRLETGKEQVLAAAATNTGQRIEGTQFISTLPITDMVTMLQPHAPDAAAAHNASGLAYLAMVLVGVVFRRDKFSENTWIYFPNPGMVFNRSYEPRNFDETMAPRGRTMVVFEVTARWDSELWSRGDSDIAAQVVDDIISSGLARRDEIERTIVQRIPHAYPLYMTGYEKHLEALCGYLAGFPNLTSTGRQGLFNHNNMDHSMLMGMRAAEHAAAGRPAAEWYGNLGEFASFRIVD